MSYLESGQAREKNDNTSTDADMLRLSPLANIDSNRAFVIRLDSPRDDRWIQNGRY